MKDDPIVQEIRQIRDAYAAQFDYNLKAIYEDLKAQEQANPKRHHSLPYKRISSWIRIPQRNLPRPQEQ